MDAPSLPPERGSALRLPFAADFGAARAAAGQVRAFLDAHGADRSELFACELCAAEACNNAVEYAPAGAPAPAIEAFVAEHRIELRVIDHTAGFDMPREPAPPSPPSERGRGLFLIRRHMDEVAYFRSGGCNVLVMRRARRGAPPRPAAPAASPEQLRQELLECRRTVAGMARELCFRSETLSAVFRCCAELGRTGEQGGFEERLLDDLLHLTSADWYVLRGLSSDGRLVVTAASEPALRTAPVAVPLAGGTADFVEARAAARRAPERLEACVGAPSDPLRAAGPLAHGLVYPLCFADTLVGTVAVGRRAGGPFGELQDEVIRTFAEFLAIQTVNLRRQEEELQARIVARELEIARDIQRSLLPPALPQLAGFGLVGGWRTAREVGGDFYDAIALNDHTLLLVVADVMGKGVPAALFATIIRGLVRGLSTRREGPARLLGRLNRLLYAELSAVSMFITAQVAHVDLARRRIVAASAGHCPLLYVPEGAREVAALPTRGMPLGVRPDTTYRSQSATLGRPGTLLLHTDGLTEARNPAGVVYGQRRLAEWLGAHGSGRLTASALRDRLAEELDRYRAGAPLGDDQAFLMLAEEAAPETIAEPKPWWLAAGSEEPVPALHSA